MASSVLTNSHHDRDQKKKKKKKDSANARFCDNCHSSELIMGSLNPCEHCRLVFYCSKACQTAHWRAYHKRLCVKLKDRRVRQQESAEEPQSDDEDEKVKCSICLGTMQQTSTTTCCTLPCGHKFHHHCMSELRSQGSGELSQVCPLCRTELPPSPEQAYEEAQRIFNDLKTTRDLSLFSDLSEKDLVCVHEIQKLWTFAAEEGHLKAQLSLGDMFKSGNGVKQDYEKALKWYLKASQANDATSQFNVAEMYCHGEGVNQNYSKALEWYLKAADQDHVEAQTDIADFYYNGNGVKQDYSKALKWHLKASQNGNSAISQYNLARMYHNGKGVKQSLSKALKWALKAASQGHIKAQYGLGIMFLKGHGVNPDSQKAIKWFIKAADQGYVDACSLLGIYHHGKVIKPDFLKAQEGYLKGADRGCAGAQYALALMFMYGHTFEHIFGKGVAKQDIVKAEEYLLKAARQGYVKAVCALGCMVCLGYGSVRRGFVRVHEYGIEMTAFIFAYTLLWIFFMIVFSPLPLGETIGFWAAFFFLNFYEVGVLLFVPICFYYGKKYGMF